MEKALNYYKRASSFFKTISFTETERKIKEIEYYLKREKEEKPLVCRKCGKRNYQNSLICERCSKILHSSYLKYLKDFAPLLLS